MAEKKRKSSHAFLPLTECHSSDVLMFSSESALMILLQLQLSWPLLFCSTGGRDVYMYEYLCGLSCVGHLVSGSFEQIEVDGSLLTTATTQVGANKYFSSALD